jgi:mannan endo-1,4-beta-mannosidase
LAAHAASSCNCAAAGASKAASSTVDPASFASRQGTRFILHDSTFYFAGANIYDLFTYGNGGNTETDSAIENIFMDKARIDSQFTRMEKYGVRVVRTWLFNHQAWHGFEPQKGSYYEPQFRQFDYIIESARKHNVMLIPAMENYWEAYGGVDSVLRWEGLAPGQSGRWKFFNRQQCPGCFTDYKNYVSYVVNRVNHYSGTAYKNDPAIFAWDLMNEPRYEKATPNEDTTGITMRLWVDTMAAYVKSLDKNHMVYAGFEGQQTKFGYGGDCGNPFAYCQSSPYLDFTSAHPYPTEGWAGLDIQKTVTLLNTWISLSHATLAKPFFLGEFNVFNTNNFGTRSQWWTAIYNVLDSTGSGGSAFWWFSDRPYDNANYGVNDGAPELTVFTAHSKRMAAKSVPVAAATTSPVSHSISPRRGGPGTIQFINDAKTAVRLSGVPNVRFYSINGRNVRALTANSIVVLMKTP